MKKMLLLLISLLVLSACGYADKENNSAGLVTNTVADGNAYERKADEKKVDEKKETLVLGIYPTVSDQLRKPIFDFNMANTAYQIEIKEYEDANQLITDIIARKAPDIMMLPPHFMLAAYADKGVLADLNPLLDSDPLINRTDLQENILTAYETEGKLFGIPINYMIRTIIAASSQYSDKDSWTLDEMMAIVNGQLQLPEVMVFYNHTKSAILDLCLMNYIERISGWDSGGVFDRDLYLKILYFANQFTPDHLEKYEVIFDLIGDSRVHLYTSYIYNVYNIQTSRFMFGEPITFLGYPAEQGSGNIAISDALMAINQNAVNQEAAWSFISSMLTEEYQTNVYVSYYLPIRKSALEENMTKGRKSGSHTWKGSDVVFESHIPREDEKQQLRDLIAGVNKTRNWDARIEDILREEAQSFLNGFKSAEEAADIAANRIAIFMNEF